MLIDAATLGRLQAIASDIREMAGEDERAYLDTLDGETDVLDLLDDWIARSQHVAALEAATREQAQRLGERARRFAEQGRASRRAILLLLHAIGERKLVRPGATLSVKSGSVSVEITDPAAVPTQLRKPGEPDKAAIRAQLEAGEDVPGCRIVTGEETISMRVS